MQRIEALVDGFHVFRRRVLFVREFLPELRGEKEAWIRRDAIEPLRGKLGAKRIVDDVLISMVSKNSARYVAS